MTAKRFNAATIINFLITLDLLHITFESMTCNRWPKVRDAPRVSPRINGNGPATQYVVEFVHKTFNIGAL